MSPEKKALAIRMFHDGETIASIARTLKVWPNSVAWMLRHGEMLERERQKRRDEGMNETKCSICGDQGHNMMSHGVQR